MKPLAWLILYALLYAVVFVMASCWPAFAQYNLSTVNIQQPQNTLNSQTTAAADTAITKSIAATSEMRVHLYSVNAYCSAGTATLTIKDAVGGTTIRSYPAAASHEKIFVVPISSMVGNGMDVVLGTCGGGNTGTLNLQASKF